MQFKKHAVTTKQPALKIEQRRVLERVAGARRQLKRAGIPHPGSSVKMSVVMRLADET